MRTRTWTVRTLIVVAAIALAAALSGLSEARAGGGSTGLGAERAAHQIGH